jgi:hypothetical protein
VNWTSGILSRRYLRRAVEVVGMIFEAVLITATRLA